MGVRVEAVVIFDESGGHRFRYWAESIAVPGGDDEVGVQDAPAEDADVSVKRVDSGIQLGRSV